MHAECGNFYRLVRSRFPEDPTRPFVHFADAGTWSYGAAERESARLAACLSGAGVRAGDRVAVQVDKTPQALFLYLACLRAGFVYLPLNTAYPERELEYYLSDARPAAAVCSPPARAFFERAGRAHGVGAVLTLDERGEGSLIDDSRRCDENFPPANREPHDTAALLYTSGTTGKPKGAMLTHRNLASNALVLHRAWGFRPSDVLLHALPLFHTHGLFVTCHCVLLNGTAMILLPRFDTGAVMRWLPAATVFMGVPTFYTRLLADERFGAGCCGGMRLFVSGSAPLQHDTFVEFEQRTGHTILERYGMTECGMIASNPLEGRRKAGSVGLPLPGISVRVAAAANRAAASGEPGGIEVRGANVFEGYWDLPEKTREEFTADGYFKTGDLGWFDEDGYITVSGRDKDLIISGGYNVYPGEVELCVERIDGIAESAVIGVPDRDLGERVTAVVVPAPGGHPDAEAILAELRPMLAGYKLPRHIEFIEELPRNAMGKVQKQLLRERFGGQGR